MRTPHSRSRAHGALTTAASLAALLLLPAAASAESATYTDPGGSGAAVTIDKTVVAPGEWIQIAGTGFVGQGGSGVPLVTLRPYDTDRGPAWAVDGPDVYTTPGAHTTEAAHWFITHQPGGTFTARMRLPVTAKVDGPDPGGLAGNHWLRVLTGAPFTSTGDNLTVPITYIAPFKVVENVTLGLTAGGPTPVFESGTTFRPGANVTVRGRGFTASSPLDVQLDGDDLGAAITTDAEGATPSTAVATLPVGTTVGPHTLRFATGAVVHEVPIRVTPVPSRTLATPVVRPGGTIAVSVKDYVGVDGAGQKVGVVIGSTVLACLTTDASGTAGGTAVVPASTAPGSISLLFNAGTSCIPPPSGGVVDDQPISSLGSPLTVAADAPALTVPGGLQGAQVAASGSGFTPNAAASATYRGQTLASALTVDGSGGLSGTVTLPEGVGGGALVVTAGSTTAAAEVAVAARPAADPPATQPTTPAGPVPTTPTVPGAPTVPAPPVQPSAPAVTAGKVSGLKAKKGGRKLSVVVRGGSRVSTVVTVRSRAKVRTTAKGRAKIVTLARRTLTRAGTYDLTLTKDGRAALRRTRSLKVVVTVAPKGGKATSTTLTLRRP